MKKSLIALAVAGIFAAPAFAATGNVDVYGKVHGSINLMNDQPSGINDVQFTSNASRIGFKGSEDLGGGMKAVWKLESGIDVVDGQGALTARNRYIGLGGGFGTVLLGKHDTPLKLVGRKVDLFGDTLADSRNVMGGLSDTRANNVLAYASPSFSGLSVLAAYVADLGNSGNAGDANNNDAWNINAMYKNGPIYLGAAYGDGDAHKNANLKGQWRLAGSYAFGDFKAVAQYDNVDARTGGQGWDAWMLGGAYKLGPIALKANYMEKNLDNTANDPKQWTVGADYTLSKRTKLYAQYADGDYITLGAGGGSTDRIGPASKSISAVSLGMIHVF